MIYFVKGVERDQLDPFFMRFLEYSNDIAGMDFLVTSGYRIGKGPHETGRAVDLRCNDSRSRFKIIRSLLLCGFTRLGLGGPKQPHVHVDMAGGKFDKDVFWMEK